MLSFYPLAMSWSIRLEYLEKDFAGESINPHNHPLRTIDVTVMCIHNVLPEKHT